MLAATGRAGERSWDGEALPQDLCSGVNVSGKGAAPQARARAELGEKNSPAVCVPSRGWRQHPIPGCGAAGCRRSCPLLQRRLVPGQRGSVGTGVRRHAFAQTSLEQTFHLAGMGLAPAQAKQYPGSPGLRTRSCSAPTGGAGGCAAPRAVDEGMEEPLGWSRGPIFLLLPGAEWPPSTSACGGVGTGIEAGQRRGAGVLEKGAEVLPGLGA